MDLDWLWAIVAIAAGLIVGSAAGSLVTRILGAERRPATLREVAPAVGSLVFSVLLVAGLMTALGYVRPDSLDKIIDDTIDYLPRVLSAVIVLIAGNVAATLAALTVERALPASTPSARRIPSLVKVVVLVFAAILAATQLGIDTTVINIVIAAIVFSIGLGAALMVGLGSRQVAAELGAGRALRRTIRPGDRLTIGDRTGTVVQVDSVAIELDFGDDVGRIPNSKLLESDLGIERAPTDDPDEPVPG